MSLAENLALALLQAQGRRAELRGKLAEELERRREELSREEGLTEVPEDLATHANHLAREIVLLEADLGQLRSSHEQQCRELDTALSALCSRLEQLRERQLEIRQRKMLARDFPAALEAFTAELAELGILDPGATPAQKEAWLKHLIPSARQVRAELSSLAIKVSRTLAGDEERRRRRRDLEQEQEQLAAEEEKVHSDLQAHALGEDLPALGLSIAEADGKILSSLRRHVLEVLLRDLRAEREGHLAPKVDPLLVLVREMGDGIY